MFKKKHKTNRDFETFRAHPVMNTIALLVARWMCHNQRVCYVYTLQPKSFSVNRTDQLSNQGISLYECYNRENEQSTSLTKVDLLI